MSNQYLVHRWDSFVARLIVRNDNFCLSSCQIISLPLQLEFCRIHPLFNFFSFSFVIIDVKGVWDMFRSWQPTIWGRKLLEQCFPKDSFWAIYINTAYTVFNNSDPWASLHNREIPHYSKSRALIWHQW